MRLAQRVRDLGESATLKAADRAAKLRADGIDVISLGAGEPDFDTPLHVRQTAIAAIQAGHTRYPKPTYGLVETRKAVCSRLKQDHGIQYKPDRVIITEGAKMAIYLACQALLEPGDEVLIPVPYWVSYPDIVRLAGGVPHFVQADEADHFKLRPERVQAAIGPKTRAAILNSPSNPGGFVYSSGDLAALGRVLAGAGLWIISDEIYNRLTFREEIAASMSAVEAAHARTICVNGASKAYAMTGWRVGFAAGDAELIAAMGKLQSQQTSGVATFVQMAYAAALTGEQSDVNRMRDHYQERGAFVHHRLNAMPGVACVPPEGAFYAFANVRRCLDALGLGGSDELAERLLSEAHLAVVPGAAFGSDDHIRISFATSMERLAEAMDRLEAFLRNAVRG